MGAVTYEVGQGQRHGSRTGELYRYAGLGSRASPTPKLRWAGVPRWVPCLNPRQDLVLQGPVRRRCERKKGTDHLLLSPPPPAAAAAARAASRRQRPQTRPSLRTENDSSCLPLIEPRVWTLRFPSPGSRHPALDTALRPRLAGRHENTIPLGSRSPYPSPTSGMDTSDIEHDCRHLPARGMHSTHRHEVYFERCTGITHSTLTSETRAAAAG